MANGDKLLLSRYKYDGFVQAYMDYISEESLGASQFERMNSILDIWKIAAPQAIMSLVLWAAAFREKKIENGWHCGSAVYPANIGTGFLPVYRLGKIWCFSLCHNGIWEYVIKARLKSSM